MIEARVTYEADEDIPLMRLAITATRADGKQWFGILDANLLTFMNCNNKVAALQDRLVEAAGLMEEAGKFLGGQE